MIRKDVFEAFKDITHMSDERIDTWFPNGRNSVRIRLKTKQELIFTYQSKNYWRLETKGAFLTDMK